MQVQELLVISTSSRSALFEAALCEALVYIEFLFITISFSISGTYGSVNIVNDTIEVDGDTTIDDYDETLFNLNCNNDTTTKLEFRPSLKPTNFGDIPAKEIIIVLLMLSLWIYSIVLTRRAWAHFLKE